MNHSDNTPTHPRFLILASVCVVVAALYFAQEVLIPIALAVLLSFLMAPLVSQLERWRLPRIPSTLIVVAIALGIVGAIGYTVYNQAISLAEQLPSYEENIVHKFEHLRPTKSSVINKAQEAIEKVGNELESPTTQAAHSTTAPSAGAAPDETGQSNDSTAMPGSKQNPYWVYVRSQSTGFERFRSILSPLLGPLGTAGVVLVFTIFFLLGRENLRNRLIRLFGRGQLTLTTQALDDAATRISRYLLMQTLVNGTYGVIAALGLWLIGVPNPALFGMICALLRFIPYIGIWIAVALPVGVTLGKFPGYAQLLETIGLFITLEIVTANAAEPWLYGSSTGMSTVAVLLSAAFWAWLWGPIGLLLATPLTAALVVTGRYVPQLQFIEILLGDEPVLSPPVRVYQRLLAMDQEEAMDVLRELRKTQSLEEIFDRVLLPALSMAEMDRHHGQLDQGRQAFIRQSLRSLIDELGDDERALLAQKEAQETVKAAKDDTVENAATAPPAKDTGNGQPDRSHLPKDCNVNLVCLPAHDEADEIVNLMLEQLLDLRGYRVTSISYTSLASEMIDQTKRKKADLVIVSSLPPAAVMHARYLCKRIRAANPEILIAVGIWGFEGDLDNAKTRIMPDGNVPVLINLTDMLHQIHQMVQPIVVRQHQSEVAAK